MKIEFEKEINEWFALAKNSIWNGKVCDEWLFAEIEPIGINSFRILWEDDYHNPEFANSLEEAKTKIISNYSKHVPFANGIVYEADEV